MNRPPNRTPAQLEAERLARCSYHYPIRPGAIYRFKSGSICRVDGDGSFRRCNEQGQPITRVRQSKKAQLRNRRLGAFSEAMMREIFSGEVAK